MVRRVTPAQFNAIMRQQQQTQQRAVDDYNRKARAHNAAVVSDQKRVDEHNRKARAHNSRVLTDRKRSIDNYNRDVRAHNTRVRSNQQRLQREIAKLGQQTSVTTRYTTTQTSARTLHEAFNYVDAVAEGGLWSERGGGLLDLAEGEAANSARVANTLLDATIASGADTAQLGQTSLTDELTGISADLDKRWRGALFALSPQNPDAARHFCTSSREVLTLMLDLEAPNTAVLEAMPGCARTDKGIPVRRAKIAYLLHRGNVDHQSLGDFVERDIEDVLGLFRVFNDGTHGAAGTLELSQLLALKDRVEDAIRFICAVIRSSDS